MRILKFLIVLTSVLTPMNMHSQESVLEYLVPGGLYYNKIHEERGRVGRMRWYGDYLTHVDPHSSNSINTVPYSKLWKEQTIINENVINEHISPDKISNISAVSFVEGKPEHIFVHESKGETIYLINITTSEVVGNYKIAGTANRDYSAQTGMFAYTKDNNLYIQNKDGIEKTITSDEESGIVNGQPVHQREFGISKGTFWSPDGKDLAFYRMDETMVTDYPLVDVSTRKALLKNIKYPMAGMPSHHVTLGVYNVASDNTIFLETDLPKEKYLTNITWSPDGKYIYIAELNRGQNFCELKRYNTSTGKLDATLFSEKHSKYVEPQTPILFLKNDPTRFLWLSNRDGFNHIYMYDTTGKVVKQVTTGKWDVASITGFDQKGENLIYTSTEKSPIEKHIYKVNLKNGKTVQLSKEEGVHTARLSASGKYISDYYTSQHNAGKMSVTEIDKNITHVVATLHNPYENHIILPEISIGTLKADDGETDLYYRLIKPMDFDPTKKYPVIVYVYGGPHSQLVDNSWMAQARAWDIHMAHKGYIVFTLDNRGTLNRGFDFENIIHRQLGVVETNDQMTGVNFLKSQPYVDTNRIGVHGWSYGGFMTLNLMLRHPETFKVGVAGGPVTDWKYYEIMYGERYMDSPEENPDGYKETSMVDRAGSLKGRLLLIHGDEDPVVVMQHSLSFIKSAVNKKTHPDFFVYPGHEHNVMGKDRMHLLEHITRYFEDFLK